MSSYIELTNKQIKDSVVFHIESFETNEEAEKFLLFVMKEISKFHGMNWSNIEKTVKKYTHRRNR